MEVENENSDWRFDAALVGFGSGVRREFAVSFGDRRRVRSPAHTARSTRGCATRRRPRNAIPKGLRQKSPDLQVALKSKFAISCDCDVRRTVIDDHRMIPDPHHRTRRVRTGAQHSYGAAISSVDPAAST